MKKRYIIISALLILTLIFAGCGSTNSGSTSSGSKTVIEPEQLISKTEAQALTKLTLKDGAKTEQAVVGQKIIF
ncbi:MAG: hypothetical protein AAGU14_12015, partial [Eubacteriaceae bacterium]